MIREFNTPPVIIEGTSHQPGVLERLRRSSLAKIAAFAGFFVLAPVVHMARIEQTAAAQDNQESIASQEKYFGVIDDEAKQPTLDKSLKVIRLMKAAGIKTIIETVWWVPGYQHMRDLRRRDLSKLENSLEAAKQEDMQVMILLEQGIDNGKAPLRPAQQRGFCDIGADLAVEHPEIKAFIVGNEPNKSRFWSPQFKPDGTDAVAEPYVNLLGTCYDKIKAKDPEALIIGGSFGSTGNDEPNPEKGSPSHSPETAIENMCSVYTKSNRNTRLGLPLMDVISVHNYPYPMGESPFTPHPNSKTITIADADKLDKVLNCFDGTAQPKPPVLWGEGGFPTSSKEDKVRTISTRSGRKVSEKVGGQWISESMKRAYCDPNSVGYFNMLGVDDPDGFWSSGIYDFNYQPKESLPIVQATLDKVNNEILDCDS